MLISKPDQWFAYYWWLDDAKAPAFARTVDIHRKPGYDPVELFIDMPTRSIPLQPSLVKGSHGFPADEPSRRGVLVCSTSDRRAAGRGRGNRRHCDLEHHPAQFRRVDDLIVMAIAEADC